MKQVRFTFDPLSYYRGKITADNWQIRLSQALGVLPLWAISGSPDESVQQTFDRCYPFGLSNISQNNKYIDDKGILQYPEDPPIYPLASLEIDDEMVYFYHLSIVGIIKEDGTQFVTRMD